MTIYNLYQLKNKKHKVYAFVRSEYLSELKVTQVLKLKLVYYTPFLFMVGFEFVWFALNLVCY
jgi:hypothetical protein